MFGWRSLAASLASRSKRLMLVSSESVRNLRATQRESFVSQAFHTWPIPPFPSIWVRTYWLTTLAGSFSISSMPVGGSSPAFFVAPATEDSPDRGADFAAGFARDGAGDAAPIACLRIVGMVDSFEMAGVVAH